MQISKIASFLFVFVCNFVLGFLPYVDNFANIGGFISGFLLGSVLLFSPQVQQELSAMLGTRSYKNDSQQGDLIDYGVKSYIKLKFKLRLDRPVLRIVSLTLFGLLYVVSLLSFFFSIYFVWQIGNSISFHTQFLDPISHLTRNKDLAFFKGRIGS